MNSKLASLLCCLIMLVSFSGCTKVTQLVKDAQPTKAELLAEINEEHRRYEGGSSAPTPYLRHYDDPADAQKSTDYLTDTYSEYDAAKELNPEEAEEDVNYLFDAFYYDFAFGLHFVKIKNQDAAANLKITSFRFFLNDFSHLSIQCVL